MEYLIKKYLGQEPNNAEEDNRKSFSKFAGWAIPSLLTNNTANIQHLNQVLENTSAISWQYGSSFSDIQACARSGDYDFVSFLVAAIGILGKDSLTGRAHYRKI